MNVLFLMGRGIEGTGNTHWTIEMERYFRSTGQYDNVKTLANCEKKWGRRLSQDNEIVEENFARNDLSSYVTENTIVIITSVPAINDSPETKETFMKYLERMHEINSNKIWYLVVDHKINSITRNFYAKEDYQDRFFAAMNLVCMHSFRNDFYSRFILKRGINLKFKDCKYTNFPMISVDTNELAQFKKPFSEKLPKTVHFIGRNTHWKGWYLLRNLQHSHLKQLGYSACIEGIELSIGFLDDVLNDHTVNRDLRPDVGKYEAKFDDDYLHYGQDCSIYGPYVRVEALERVSKSKFAFFMTYIGDAYGGPVENTFLENVSVGTVTVIRKRLYECGEFVDETNTIRKLNEFTPEELGVIILDEEDPTSCVEKMQELEDDEALYNQYVENSINFVKKYYDREVVQQRLAYRLFNPDGFGPDQSGVVFENEKKFETINLWDC